MGPQDTATQEPSQGDGKAICPYCGHRSTSRVSCSVCGGLFEPLSQQATQNAMGPWQVRDKQMPFRPLCSYQTLKTQIAKGKIGPDSILRGPTTNHFWARATRIPGISILFGVCHSCSAKLPPSTLVCPTCNASQAVPGDRQHLGLLPVQPLPGQAVPSQVVPGAVLPNSWQSGLPGAERDGASVLRDQEDARDEDDQRPALLTARSRIRSLERWVWVFASLAILFGVGLALALLMG